MYKNLSDIKKRLWSKVVVLKAFFPRRLLCLIAGNSFFQNTCFFVSLVASILSSIDMVFFRRALADMNCLYAMYLTDISISKEHVQSYIWVVPSLFHEAFCSDLVFLRVMCFFETSIYSNPFFQRYWVNSQFQLQPSIDEQHMQPNVLSSLLYFYGTGIVVRRCHSY